VIGLRGRIALTALVSGALLIPLAALVLSGSIEDEIAKLKRGLESGRCGTCHPLIVREQMKSAHAKAGRDERFPARYGDERYDAARFAEPVLMTGLNKPPVKRSEHPKLGVNCLTCHLGPDGKMHGPKTDKISPFHGITPNEEIFSKTDRLCLTCHGSGELPKMNALASTKGKRAKRCIDCHMPIVKRPPSVLTPRRECRSHEFSLGKAASKGLTAEVDGDKLILKSSSVHPIPHLPGRGIIVQIFKADGGILLSLTRDRENPIGPGGSAEISRPKGSGVLKVLLRRNPSDPPGKWELLLERKLGPSTR